MKSNTYLAKLENMTPNKIHYKYTHNLFKVINISLEKCELKSNLCIPIYWFCHLHTMKHINDTCIKEEPLSMVSDQSVNKSMLKKD